jgi:hypothetical protein
MGSDPRTVLLNCLFSYLVLAGSLIKGGSTHTEQKPVMRINARLLGHAYAVPLRGPLEHALNNTAPTLIEIGITPLADQSPPMQGIVAQTTRLAPILTHVISPIFLSFFERYNMWLTTNLDAVNWPMTLKFARVVRNAVAHHGTIKIKDPSTPPVTWHGLSYSHTDNEKKIVGFDLEIGEFLGLMFEVKEELDGLAVPIL